MNPRCPGESYDLTPLLCRARQAKGYEKCPSCTFRGAVESPAAPAVATVTAALEAPAPEFGRELDAPAPAAPRLPERILSLRQGAAAAVGAATAASAASLHGKGSLSGIWAAARRIYEYF